jgi:hypothetical protein
MQAVNYAIGCHNPMATSRSLNRNTAACVSRVGDWLDTRADLSELPSRQILAAFEVLV